MLGGLAIITAPTVELAEAHVTVEDVGELDEKLLAHALGLVEAAFVDQVEGAVRKVVEAFDLGIASEVGHPGRLEGRRTSSGARCVVGCEAALLIFFAAAAGTGMIATDLGHVPSGGCLISKLLVDDRFYHVLAGIDLDLAETARLAGCSCSGVLHSARYPRKPRGLPHDPGRDERRASFCCASCRRRTTPRSVRFLGRRVYLGAVVVLATALQQGATPWRARRLRDLFGMSAQTLARWRAWWAEAFAESAFWRRRERRFRRR